MPITLTLPELYTLQREIVDHPAKRKVINAGRRAGKTEMWAVGAIEAMLAGRKVLLSSTSQDQADIFWTRIKSWTAPIHAYCYKNETKRILEFNGGRIRVKTGSDADEDAVRRLMIAPQFIRPHKIQDQDHFLLFVLLCVH